MGLMQFKKKSDQVLSFEATITSVNLLSSCFRGWGKKISKLSWLTVNYISKLLDLMKGEW